MAFIRHLRDVPLTHIGCVIACIVEVTLVHAIVMESESKDC